MLCIILQFCFDTFKVLLKSTFSFSSLVLPTRKIEKFSSNWKAIEMRNQNTFCYHDQICMQSQLHFSLKILCFCLSIGKRKILLKIYIIGRFDPSTFCIDCKELLFLKAIFNLNLNEFETLYFEMFYLLMKILLIKFMIENKM